MEQAIILFTRVPVAGQTKTRLMPLLSGEDCAALHSGFIRSAARTCQGVDADLLVYYALPQGAHPSGERKNAGACIGTLAKLAKGSKGFYPQKGEGLGERMSQAFERSEERRVGKEC